jgi:hypothetical protein
MRADSLVTGLIGCELDERELRAASGGFDDIFRCGNEPRWLRGGTGPRPVLELSTRLGDRLFSSDPDGDPVSPRGLTRL